MEFAWQNIFSPVNFCRSNTASIFNSSNPFSTSTRPSTSSTSETGAFQSMKPSSLALLYRLRFATAERDNKNSSSAFVLPKTRESHHARNVSLLSNTSTLVEVPTNKENSLNESIHSILNSPTDDDESAELQRKLDLLTQELATAKLAQKTAEAAVNDQVITIREQNQTIQTLRHANSIQQDEIDFLKNQNNTLSEDLSEATNAYTAIRTRYEGLLDDTTNHYEKRVTGLRDENEALNAEIVTLSHNNTDLRDDNKDLMVWVEQVQQEIEETEQDCSEKQQQLTVFERLACGSFDRMAAVCNGLVNREELNNLNSALTTAPAIDEPVDLSTDPATEAAANARYEQLVQKARASLAYAAAAPLDDDESCPQDESDEQYEGQLEGEVEAMEAELRAMEEHGEIF